MAGLRVGQAYGVFHRPGFGLLVSVPRSLSTQPPFATQVLTYFTCDTEVLKFIIFLSCSTLHWLLAIFIEC